MRKIVVYVLPSNEITTDFGRAARAWEDHNRQQWSITHTAPPTAVISVAPTTAAMAIDNHPSTIDAKTAPITTVANQALFDREIS